MGFSCFVNPDLYLIQTNFVVAVAACVCAVLINYSSSLCVGG